MFRYMNPQETPKNPLDVSINEAIVERAVRSYLNEMMGPIKMWLTEGLMGNISRDEVWDRMSLGVEEEIRFVKRDIQSKLM